jgi:phosphoheptose isomerase
MGLSLEEQININIKTHLSLLKLNSEVNKTIKVIAKKIKNGGKLLLCGNGGSAADAQHLAAEFLVRLRPNVNRKAIPAISLAQDTSRYFCNNFASDRHKKRYFGLHFNFRKF